MGLEVPVFFEALYSPKNTIGLYIICVTIIYKWNCVWFDAQRKKIEIILRFHVFDDFTSVTDGRKIISEVCYTLFELCRVVVT